MPCILSPASLSFRFQQNTQLYGYRGAEANTTHSLKLLRFLSAFVVEPDLEWAFIDGSIVKADRHSNGTAFGQENAIRKSSQEIQPKFICLLIPVALQSIY